MLFIDSNIWCYYFDISAREHKKVAEYLERTLNKETVMINTVIIMEVAHFLIKNLAEKAHDKVNTFLTLPFEITDLDYSQVVKSVEILSRHSDKGIGGRDATIMAAMAKAGINKIVTNDSAFTKIKGLKVLNPVKSG